MDIIIINNKVAPHVRIHDFDQGEGADPKQSFYWDGPNANSSSFLGILPPNDLMSGGGSWDPVPAIDLFAWGTFLRDTEQT